MPAQHIDRTIDAAEQLTVDRINQVKSAASGKSEADARQAIAGIEGVEVVDISVSPGLLDKTLPGEGKIDVKAE